VSVRLSPSDKPVSFCSKGAKMVNLRHFYSIHGHLEVRLIPRKRISAIVLLHESFDGETTDLFATGFEKISVLRKVSSRSAEKLGRRVVHVKLMI
jgi:hypothetical protein